MRDVVKYEKIVDENVLKCYYNICKYYKKDVELIRMFLNK